MNTENEPLRTAEDVAKWLARRYKTLPKAAVTERELVARVLIDFVLDADLSTESGWPTYLPDDIQPKREGKVE